MVVGGVSTHVAWPSRSPDPLPPPAAATEAKIRAVEGHKGPMHSLKIIEFPFLPPLLNLTGPFTLISVVGLLKS